MADSDNADFPDVPPAEVPEEFAATYRDAYRRALGDAETPPQVSEPVEPRPGAHRVTEYRAGTPLEHLREEPWFVPLVAVLLVLVLVLGGWLLARALGGDDEPASTPAQGPGPTGASTSDAPIPGRGEAPKSPAPKSHRGPVAPAKVTAIAATCTLEPGVDSAGRKVTYVAAHAVDGDATTAWRCEGDAVGERLVLRLPEGVDVAAVGLVPGYAKTDPANGANRYAENNRITSVRWILATGVSVRQRLDPDPDKRGVQTLRIPVTFTNRVVLEILAIERGSRNATAISEIRISVPG